MKYLFKSNKRSKEATIYRQIDKVIEEANEARDALNDMEPDHRVAEELLDTIWACEGALRKLPKRAVDDACEIVSEKAVARGDV